jgi:predicted MFS family arabinose efflux permease
MEIAGISIAAGLPWVLFSLLGGALVDRMDRRGVMVRVQAARAVVVAAFTIYAVVSIPLVPVLYVLMFVITTGEVLVSSAAPSMLPRMLPRNLLSSANARLFGGQTSAEQIAGPPLGSFLLALAVAAPFAADAVSYLAGAVLLAGIAGDFRPDKADSPTGTIWHSAVEGVAYVWRHNFLRTIILGYGAANVARSMTMSIFVLFSIQMLRITGFGYGLLLACTAVGALAGSLCVGILRRYFSDAFLVVAPMVLLGSVTVVLATTSSPYVAGACNALFGFGSMVWNVVGVSAQQRAIPDALMGRVMAVDSLVTWGALPVGSLLGGLLATALSLRTSILSGGVLILSSVLALGWTLYRSTRVLPADAADQGVAS